MALKTRKGLQDGKLYLPKDHNKIYISDIEKQAHFPKKMLENIEMSQEISELKKEIASIKCKTNDTGTSS